MLTPRSDRPDRDGPSSTRAKRRSDRCRSFRYRRNNALEYADPESRRRAKCNTVRLTSVILDTSSSRFRGVSGSAGSSHHRRLLYAQMNRLTLPRLWVLIHRLARKARHINGLDVSSATSRTVQLAGVARSKARSRSTCRWRRKGVPVWRSRGSQVWGYALACGGAQKEGRS
jgi:hypothetical protein